MSQISSMGSAASIGSFLQTKNNKDNANAMQANFSAGENSSTAFSAHSDDSISSNSPEAIKKTKKDYSAEFLAYMKKTPAQRLREDILKKLGLTESDLESMPPDKRAAVEQQIAEEIKRSLAGNGSPQDSDLQKFGAPSGQKLSDDLTNALLQLQEIGA